ncbi:MAG: acetyl-CoA C-acyltransferase, partial [Deltaproteobacteria bacterium]|nr:acetyl-CoA C-acyltransferase [Deltaproteobacteria bacterium]
MTEAYIYDAVRTPRGKGKRGGALNQVTPTHLAVTVLAALRDRNGLDTSLVDDIVYGVVEATGEQGGDLPRIAALCADYAETVTGIQVNRFCGSALDACNLAAAKIMAGQSECCIGGGVESMSRMGMAVSGAPWLSDPQVSFKTFYSMQGVSADAIATRWGYSREALDAYAVESQRRAGAAWEKGYFRHSIVPV